MSADDKHTELDLDLVSFSLCLLPVWWRPFDSFLRRQVRFALRCIVVAYPLDTRLAFCRGGVFPFSFLRLRARFVLLCIVYMLASGPK